MNCARPSARKKSRTQFFLLCLAVVFLAVVPRLATAGNFYAGTSPANVPWPGGVVPYEFTNALTAAQSNTYFAGLREWQLAANVKFVPHTNQTRWILFTYNTNWIDNVSPGTNPQVVTVSSLSRAQVCHEMGHSFGFNHENIRRDATNFISVLTNNIANEPANIIFFTVDPTTVTNGNYDYESVMHLGWDFVSTNPGVAATQQPKLPNFPRYQYRMGNYCLSPGDRAALAYLYGPPAVPLTNVVTTTADVGPGSLRAAIYYATDHAGTTVKFNIPTSDLGYSNGVFNLHLTGHLPPLVANGMVIDGSTQPGFTSQPLIIVDASQIIPETFTSDTFLIYSSSNQLKKISFTGFDWNGITLIYADATNNTISGCWLGVDATGTHAAPNAYQGIFIASGASGNIIGGTNALARNVLSGNAQYGVFITDSNTTRNVVLGNFIGTDASGSNALANGKSGVIIGGGAGGNIIGGTNSAARNIISGNTEDGIFLTNTTANVVSGNYLGVNVAGTAALANQASGIALYGGVQNLIGTGNVLSGNGEYGVDIRNSVASGNWIQGNYIGLDASGANVVPNALAGVLLFSGAQSNTIGGTVAAARNVLSGNATYGMIVEGANGNVIQGNYIGPDVTGKTAPANNNSYGGIGVWGGSANNLFGGTSPGAGNLISGNNSYGIFLADPGTSGNLLAGNFFGTDATGTNALGNWYAGVALWNGATSNSVGSLAAGAGNTIAFNGWAGVNMYDAPTTNNPIRGNSFFSNTAIGIDLVVAGEPYPGVTTNDLGDADSGPNDLQNFPVITNAFGYGGSTIVLGKLNSLAARTFAIDVYRNVSANPSGYGEGQFYVGTVSVTTDGSGNAAFALTNGTGNFTGQYFSATATAATGDTSEFSADVLATNAPAASAQFGAPFVWRTNGFIFSLTLATNFPYHIQATTNLAAKPIVWTDLTNFTPAASSLTFTDRTATNFRARFYRVVSP
jgi:parallel beta-helix repeat protein